MNQRSDNSRGILPDCSELLLACIFLLPVPRLEMIVLSVAIGS